MHRPHQRKAMRPGGKFRQVLAKVYARQARLRRAIFAANAFGSIGLRIKGFVLRRTAGLKDKDHGFCHTAHGGRASAACDSSRARSAKPHAEQAHAADLEQLAPPMRGWSSRWHPCRCMASLDNGTQAGDGDGSRAGGAAKYCSKEFRNCQPKTFGPREPPVTSHAPGCVTIEPALTALRAPPALHPPHHIFEPDFTMPRAIVVASAAFARCSYRQSRCTPGDVCLE